MVEFKDPFQFPNWPDWLDSMKKVDAIFEDGAIVLDGTLLVDDYGFDGEDEFPIFVIEDSQGNKHDFTTVAKFRFV